jgi:hypothetical protein
MGTPLAYSAPVYLPFSTRLLATRLPYSHAASSDLYIISTFPAKFPHAYPLIRELPSLFLPRTRHSHVKMPFYIHFTYPWSKKSLRMSQRLLVGVLVRF